ncbi:MAG: hypothetical protein FJ108_03015 [Deltaproteobacteria bacterium]|nr:hypothetical protein [Deltaproteobacteria bacterium]
MTQKLTKSLLCLCLVSCATPLESRLSPGEPGAGVSYFLPRQLLKLTVTRTDKTQRVQYLANLKAEKTAAEKALETVDKVIVDLQKLRERLKLAPGPRAVEAVKAVDARVEEASTALTVQKAAIDNKALEIKQLEQKMAEDKSTDCADAIALAVLPPEPDPSLRYVAQLGHSASRDDKWTIATTPAGLLSSADVVLTDRSADIVVEVVRSAALVAKAGTTLATLSRETMPDDKKPACVPFRKEHIFDPDPKRSDLATLNQVLDTWGVDLDVKLSASPSKELEPPQQKCFGGVRGTIVRWLGGCRIDSSDGLYYRRPIPYGLSILRADGSLLHETRVALPNGAPIDLLPVPDPWLVTNKQSMKFDQGMLTFVESEQPSQFLELARFPGRVAKELISVPAEMFQLKIDHSSQETAEIEAEKAIVDAQKALLESRDALATLQGEHAED